MYKIFIFYFINVDRSIQKSSQIFVSLLCHEQWRILINIVGGAKIIRSKFIHLIIVTNIIKMNT